MCTAPRGRTHERTDQIVRAAETSCQAGAVHTCPYEQIVERSEQLVRSGLFADLGLAALEKFRVETSMAGNLASALRLPVFEALSSRAV